MSEQLTICDWAVASNLQDKYRLDELLESLYSIIPRIWEDVHDTTKNDTRNDGRKNFNTHPIVRMYVYKMFQLVFGEPIGDNSCALFAAQHRRAINTCKNVLRPSPVHGLTSDETNEYFEYLDILREEGSVNMFGAEESLMHEYILDRNTARAVVISWMKTFGERYKNAENNED